MFKNINNRLQNFSSGGGVASASQDVSLRFLFLMDSGYIADCIAFALHNCTVCFHDYKS